MNIFILPNQLPEEEFVETLAAGEGILIERIISHGHTTLPDVWLDQPCDEWVMVLQGEAKLTWGDGRELEMKSGDWVLIKAGERHRVSYSSTQPPCIWLAVHGLLKQR